MMRIMIINFILIIILLILFPKVSATPPPICFSAKIDGPEVGYVNETLTFSAKNSTAICEAEINQYSWDFDSSDSIDQNLIGSEYENVTFSYNKSGIYTITLVVYSTYLTGTFGIEQHTITILNNPPVANFRYNGPIYYDEIVTFNASESFDSDGQIVNYTWIFGDDTIGYGKIISHKFSAAGLFNISLIVKDNQGELGDSSYWVTVNDPWTNPPISHISIATDSSDYFVDEPISFNGSQSYDLGGEIIIYNWSFGDGAVGTGSSITHLYTSAGNYTISLTVIDNHGLNNTTFTTIVVKNNESISSQNKNGDDKIPGFEILFVFFAFIYTLFWKRKKTIN